MRTKWKWRFVWEHKNISLWLVSLYPSSDQQWENWWNDLIKATDQWSLTMVNCPAIFLCTVDTVCTFANGLEMPFADLLMMVHISTPDPPNWPWTYVQLCNCTSVSGTLCALLCVLCVCTCECVAHCVHFCVHCVCALCALHLWMCGTLCSAPQLKLDKVWNVLIASTPCCPCMAQLPGMMLTNNINIKPFSFSF